MGDTLMLAKRIDPNGLNFHAISPMLVHDVRTGKPLQLDGWWKTADGRTMFAALSSGNQPRPGSILRRKDELETVKSLT